MTHSYSCRHTWALKMHYENEKHSLQNIQRNEWTSRENHPAHKQGANQCFIPKRMGEPLLEIIHENGKTLMHKVKNPRQEQATQSHKNNEDSDSLSSCKRWAHTIWSAHSTRKRHSCVPLEQLQDKNSKRSSKNVTRQLNHQTSHSLSLKEVVTEAYLGDLTSTAEEIDLLSQWRLWGTLLHLIELSVTVTEL